MSAGSKLSISLVAVLLAFGLGACGGDEDSGSTATDAVSQNQPQSGEGADGAGQAEATADEEGLSGSAGGSGGSDGSGDDDGSSDEGSEEFVPRQHDDSGGGSAPYRVKGGDNSVQEFGAEADDDERDAAARVVHNFLDARAQEAWEAACSFLSTEVRGSLEEFAVKAREAAAKQGKADQTETSCAGILGRLTNRAALPELRREAARADVRSLRIEGDRAFVIYTGLGGTVIAIPVNKENGSWKVAGLGGTPLN